MAASERRTVAELTTTAAFGFYLLFARIFRCIFQIIFCQPSTFAVAVVVVADIFGACAVRAVYADYFSIIKIYQTPLPAASRSRSRRRYLSRSRQKVRGMANATWLHLMA